jgi:nitrite reductase/ring-hydroxylating ferredoxin subunit
VAQSPCNSTYLKGAWYPVARAKAIKKNRLFKSKVAEIPIVLTRLDRPCALVDSCPHRGFPLSYGSIHGNDIQCKYHGWRISASNGECIRIPCLTEAQRQLGIETKIKSMRLPCLDRGGLTWVYVASSHEEPYACLESLPAPFDRDPNVYIEKIFKADIDQSTIGLIDPVHVPFVHTSRWWKKTNPDAFNIERRDFEPSARGFTLKRHVIPNSAKPYKLLGEPVQTEIRFELPSLRLEIIEGTRHAACSLTVLAPIDKQTTRVHQCLYWSSPWLLPAKPILKLLGEVFLDQDRVVVEQQQEGLEHHPSLTLIEGADTQAKWYLRIKREMERCQREGSSFTNPLGPASLEWMC